MAVVFIHGFSAEGKDEKLAGVQKIYGDLPRMIGELPAQTPITVNVSRWVSLDDGLNLDDLTFALERAIRQGHPTLLTKGFDAIVHSTGALVIRNWIRRFTVPGECPVKRVIYLAGANWGSGWAHVGKSQLARWARMAMGTQRGMQVLDSLEFGSWWTADLHEHFLPRGSRMFEDYGVMEFCIIGSQVTGPGIVAPVRYGREDGADGVVRVAAGNLNHTVLRIGPNPDHDVRTVNWKAAQKYAEDLLKQRSAPRQFDGAFDAPYYRTLGDYRPQEAGRQAPADMGPGAESRQRTAFALAYNAAHSGEDLGVVSGRSVARGIVTDLISPALTCTPNTYEEVCEQYDQVTTASRQKAWTPEHADAVQGSLPLMQRLALGSDFRPASQYDAHAQVIVRVSDQNGRPVQHCDIYFNSFGGSAQPGLLINKLIEDHHQNGQNKGAHTFYLRCERLTDSGTCEDRLAAVHGLDLEVSVIDPMTQRVVYVPLRMRLSAARLQQFIRPDRTTVIDVRLLRLPDDRSFVVI